MSTDLTWYFMYRYWLFPKAAQLLAKIDRAILTFAVITIPIISCIKWILHFMYDLITKWEEIFRDIASPFKDSLEKCWIVMNNRRFDL